MVCLDCLPTNGDYTSSLDFCDDTRCIATRVKGRSFPRGPHAPSHDLLKVTTTQHVHDMHALEEVSRRALVSAKRALRYSILPASYGDEDNLYTEDESQTADDVDPEQYSKPKSPAASPVRRTRTWSKRGRRPPAPRRRSSQSNISCSVCTTSLDLSTSCWFCVVCFDYGEQIRDTKMAFTNSRSTDHRVFLCNDCESNTLLACIVCAKPYKQPTWYYGSCPSTLSCPASAF